MANTAPKYTAAQRAQMFAQSTRQNYQMLPKQTVDGGARTMTFSLPKARLLSNILLDFDFSVKITHATKTTLPEENMDDFSPYALIRRISLDLNNGFQPYVIGGEECAMLNMVHRGSASFVSAVNTNYDTDGSSATDNAYGYWKDKGASASGKVNHIRFTLELPLTLNDRDPVGIILLQNDQTNVSLLIDLANGSELVKNIDGYTVEITKCGVQCATETFSIPAVADAFPDISVLKLTNSRVDSLLGEGQHIIKLETGNIYRRLIFRVTDANGLPLADEDFLSDISLVFNQADTNYNINARLLRMLNTQHYGFTLPKGMYVFDFAYQGIVGLSGTRDYIDTERLTEFWLRFNTSKSVKVNIIRECLGRLSQ